MPKISDGPANTRRAHNHINNGLRDGTIKKPERCQKCGRKAKLEFHHTNYNKPGAGRWLCLKCHAGEKGKAKNSAKGKWRDSKRKK